MYDQLLAFIHAKTIDHIQAGRANAAYAWAFVLAHTVHYIALREDYAMRSDDPRR